jgi:hypothetical protein
MGEKKSLRILRRNSLVRKAVVCLLSLIAFVGVISLLLDAQFHLRKHFENAPSCSKMVNHVARQTSILKHRSTYDAATRMQMNTHEAEDKRFRELPSTMKVTDYHHPKALDRSGWLFLKLLLRTLTNADLFVERLDEPATYRSDNITHRGNSGCDMYDPNCVLTWDGWARAMGTGDVLLDVLQRQVPGAVVEVGVYKGGLSAYLQGMLLATGEASAGREMWLIDSFQGLPPADLMTSKNDNSGSKLNSKHMQEKWAGDLSVGLQTVYRHLENPGLLEIGNVHFLEGYVQDTLPGWTNVTEIAFLRIDVDIYSATFDTLHYLYPKLQVGGAVLFDDHKFEYARAAVDNYRKQHNITTPLEFLPGCIDPMSYWIKEEM